MKYLKSNTNEKILRYVFLKYSSIFFLLSDRFYTDRRVLSVRSDF